MPVKTGHKRPGTLVVHFPERHDEVLGPGDLEGVQIGRAELVTVSSQNGGDDWIAWPGDTNPGGAGTGALSPLMVGQVFRQVRAIADSGIVYGLGTDATIVSHYQPFITLGWLVSGLDLAGNKALNETLTREEALIAHTRNNAWLFQQEANLGTLEPGKLADLVVLDRDYLAIPAAQPRA